MRSTFKLLFYINRGKIKADGTTAVMCRISIDGKAAALTTGIYCPPTDWNARKGEIRTERDNNHLTEFRARLEQTYDHILKEHGAVSAELLKNTVVGVNSTPTMLLEAGEVERERLRPPTCGTSFVRGERRTSPLPTSPKSSARDSRYSLNGIWATPVPTSTIACVG